jgi:hypothetical protein
VSTIRLKRVLADPSAPPKAAHKFMFTRVGVDIVLEVGYFDLPALREAVERGKEAPKDAEPEEVTLHITDRFVLSPQGVTDLAGVAKQLESDMSTYIRDVEVSAPGKEDT